VERRLRRRVYGDSSSTLDLETTAVDGTSLCGVVVVRVDDRDSGMVPRVDKMLGVIVGGVMR
jgi:hypothetical protein